MEIGDVFCGRSLVSHPHTFLNITKHWKLALKLFKRKPTFICMLAQPLEQKKAYTLPKRGSLQVDCRVTVTNFGSEAKPPILQLRVVHYHVLLVDT